jgi:hypothetical protein
LPSMLKSMAKKRLSIRWLCTSYACIIPTTPAPGMRVFPMFNTTITNPYIIQLTTYPFKWGWDFNHWVPWMLHYPLWPPRKTHHMLQL